MKQFSQKWVTSNKKTHGNTYLEVHVKKRLLCLRVCTYIYVKSRTPLFLDVTLLPCYPAPECQTYTRYTETAVWERRRWPAGGWAGI